MRNLSELIVLQTTIIAIIVIPTSIMVFLHSCTDIFDSPVEETPCVEPTIIHDTIIDSKCIKQLDSLTYVHELTKDSLKYMKDSLREDLFVARYKLGRIKYYTDIAAKGNNIKFYRGWVLRTLND